MSSSSSSSPLSPISFDSFFKTNTKADRLDAGAFGILLQSKNENKVFKMIACEDKDYYDDPEFYRKSTTTTTSSDSINFASVDFFRELYWCLDPKMANCAVRASRVIFLENSPHPSLSAKSSSGYWGFEMKKATTNLVQALCKISKNDFSWYYDPTEHPVNIIFDIACQLVTCLEEMDRVAHVSHLDLKPGNVLYFKESNAILLCDGGSSRFAADTYKENTITAILTTLLYRCPEMHAKKSFGKSADIWSLGCILYELFSGRILFFVDKDETLTRLYESENVFTDPETFGVLQISYDTIPSVSINKIRKEKEEGEDGKKRPRLEPSLLESRMNYLRKDMPFQDLVKNVILACLQFNPDHRPKIGDIKMIFDWIEKQLDSL